MANGDGKCMSAGEINNLNGSEAYQLKYQASNESWRGENGGQAKYVGVVAAALAGCHHRNMSG
jgi:hypothetical protein